MERVEVGEIVVEHFGIGDDAETVVTGRTRKNLYTDSGRTYSRSTGMRVDGTCMEYISLPKEGV